MTIHLHCFEGAAWCKVQVYEKRTRPRGGGIEIKPLKPYEHCTQEGIASATCTTCVANYSAARLRMLAYTEAP